MNYEGAKCGFGHNLEIISEGYAICTSKEGDIYPWAFTMPVFADSWMKDRIRGADGGLIPAWVGLWWNKREDALAQIQADIDARRSMPFDEERERARLMPV